MYGIAGLLTGRTLAGRYLIEGIVPILALPALLVISQAPWVAAYRALSQPAAEVQA